MWKKIKEEIRPCVKCKTNHLIYNRSKWLCQECEQIETKKRRGDLHSLFLEIWKERSHICNRCGKKLGNDPKPIFFSHIKSRGSHPELKMEKENIELLCEKCHYKWDFQSREDW